MFCWTKPPALFTTKSALPHVAHTDPTPSCSFSFLEPAQQQVWLFGSVLDSEDSGYIAYHSCYGNHVQSIIYPLIFQSNQNSMSKLWNASHLELSQNPLSSAMPWLIQSPGMSEMAKIIVKPPCCKKDTACSILYHGIITVTKPSRAQWVQHPANSSKF